MAREVYLADTSVFARLPRDTVAAAFAPLASAGKVALCAPVAFELGFAARSPTDYNRLMEYLAAYASAPTGEGDHQRALGVQQQLAGQSQHRAISLVDALVAAVAETRGLTVLHYDADFELIARFTGQSQRWIVPRGTAD